MQDWNAWWEKLDDHGTYYKPLFRSLASFEGEPGDDAFARIAELTEVTRYGASSDEESLVPFDIRDLVPLEQLPRVEEVYLVACDLKSLEGIDRLPLLARVGLVRAPLEDPTPLAACPMLVELTVTEPRYPAEALAGLTGVTKLVMAYAPWESLAPLGALHAIEQLDCHDSGELVRIEGVQNMPGLRTLDISNTAVADLGPLAEARALELLMASDSAVTSVAPLRGLPRLERLELGGCPIEDISPLTELPSLESLDVSGRAFQDLAQLVGSTSLVELQISGIENLENVEALAEIPSLRKVTHWGSVASKDVKAVRKKRKDIKFT